MRHWIVASTRGETQREGDGPAGRVEATKIVLEETKNDEDDVRGFVDGD